MFGYAIHRHDIRQVDFCLCGTGKFNLGFFSGLFQTLQGHGILFEVKSFIFLKLFSKPVNDHLVEIVPTQVGVAIGRFDLKNAVTQFKDRDVKGTSSQVKYGDLQIGSLLIKTVCQ